MRLDARKERTRMRLLNNSKREGPTRSTPKAFSSYGEKRKGPLEQGIGVFRFYHHHQQYHISSYTSLVSFSFLVVSGRQYQSGFGTDQPIEVIIRESIRRIIRGCNYKSSFNHLFFFSLERYLTYRLARLLGRRNLCMLCIAVCVERTRGREK